MSRYFMYGTSLQESEQMTMSVPNFLPRTKGMIIMGKKTIDEKEELKRCVYCSEYSKGGCRTAHCPYLLDRADFGQIGYANFIKDSFWDSDGFFFKKRLRGLFRSFTGEWFMSSYHKDRYFYLTQGSALLQNTKKQNLALLYLLTANEQLWDRAKEHIYPNKIALSEIPLTGHRSEKLPKTEQEMKHLKQKLLAEIDNAIENGIDTFYMGSCYGFDLLAAQMVLRRKKVISLNKPRQNSIKLVAIIPFEEQASRWSEKDRELYFDYTLPYL